MATYWPEKGGWRMWRILAVAFSIFLINTQNPGWSLGRCMHSLYSLVVSRFFRKLWFFLNGT